ncbi:MAG: twin-arginine translocation signal domain-containing protein [Acidobacteria bacterium]|nr:twin-arginine translocation signal domain-containing protein [Acidobacteriota bacterium]MCI0721629.1 twin-arginine translocation signal domain-containing protein [Acidobacteriota bacterium]
MIEKEQSVNHGMSRRSFVRLLAVGGSSALLAQANMALPGKMARFETRGDAYSRGKQQGEAFREKFQPWMSRNSLRSGIHD